MLGAVAAVASVCAIGCSAPSVQNVLPPSSLDHGIPLAFSSGMPIFSFPTDERSHIVIVHDGPSSEWNVWFSTEDDTNTYRLIHTWVGDMTELMMHDFNFDAEYGSFVYTAKAEGFPEGEYWNAYRFESKTQKIHTLCVIDQRIHRILPFENNSAIVVLQDQSVHVARNNRLATVREKPEWSWVTRVACSPGLVVYTEHDEGTDSTVVLANPGVRQKDTLSILDGVFGLACAPDSSRVAVSMLSSKSEDGEIVPSRTEIYGVTKDERGRYRFCDDEPIVIEGAQNAMFVPGRDIVVTGHVDPVTHERWTSLYQLTDKKATKIGTIECPWYLLRDHGWVTSEAISVHVTGRPGLLWTQPLPN